MAFDALLVGWMALMSGLLYLVTEAAPAKLASFDVGRAPPLSRLDTRFLNVLTLGYRGVFDDFSSIWLQQLLVDPQVRTADAAKLYRTVRAVTRHNPKIESLYMLSCFVFTFDLRQPQYCEQITFDGLKALPNSWHIPAVQGFVFAFKMNAPESAAMYYGLAASRVGAPPFLKSYADKLRIEHRLDEGELRKAMSELLQRPGGSQFGDFLRDIRPLPSGDEP